MPLQILSKILDDRVKEIKTGLRDRAAGKQVNTHIPTGIGPIDRTFGGLERGCAGLVLGHSGDGKTALMQALARGAAAAGFGVLEFLLEDPVRRAADRELANLTGEASHRIGRLDVPAGFPGQLDIALKDAEWAHRIATWNGDAEPAEVLQVIRDTPTVGGRPVGVVLVDYAQRFSDGEQSLESICGLLARDGGKLAEERQFSFVLGSQVATKVLERGQDRFSRKGDVEGFCPHRGDAMWSRRMEQFVRWEWVWFRPGRWAKEMGLSTPADDYGELRVVKASYGPEGVVSLGWDGPRTRIYERPSK